MASVVVVAAVGRKAAPVEGARMGTGTAERVRAVVVSAEAMVAKGREAMAAVAADSEVAVAWAKRI